MGPEPTITTEISEAAKVAAGRGEPVTVTLKVPVVVGKETIEELTIRPSAKAFRGFSLPINGDGGVLFQPYELAAVGVAMAGQTRLLLDKLDVEDMIEVAQVVMGFLGRGLKIGSTASP